MGTVIDAYASRKHQEAMQDTWGHLAPEENKEYTGWMLWAYSAYGDTILLESDFEGLNDSPWLFEVMMAFIGNNIPEVGVFRWSGVTINSHFKGNIKKIVTT